MKTGQLSLERYVQLVLENTYSTPVLICKWCGVSLDAVRRAGGENTAFCCGSHHQASQRYGSKFRKIDRPCPDPDAICFRPGYSNYANRGELIVAAYEVGMSIAQSSFDCWHMVEWYGDKILNYQEWCIATRAITVSDKVIGVGTLQAAGTYCLWCGESLENRLLTGLSYPIPVADRENEQYCSGAHMRMDVQRLFAIRGKRDKPRCPTPTKKTYVYPGEAEVYGRYYGQRPYRCKCDNYHLTSQEWKSYDDRHREDR